MQLDWGEVLARGVVDKIEGLVPVGLKEWLGLEAVKCPFAKLI
jgi:hypothetical protein